MDRAFISDAERIQYHRELYRKSPRFRLSRINYSRRRLGLPEAASLDQVQSRIGAEDRRAELLRLLGQGEGIKRAAHKVGVAYRTARRYRQQGERG